MAHGEDRQQGRPTPPPAGGDALGARRRLWIRLIVSPASLLLVVGVLWVHEATGRALTTDLFLALVAAAGAVELLRMFEAGGVSTGRALSTITALGTGALAGVGLFAPDDPALRMELRALLPGLVLLALLLLRLFDLRRETLGALGAGVLPLLYVGLPLSLSHDVAPADALARWLVYVLVVAKASDIGGWLVGKPFGRHKLVPRISPKKSWEGLAGGLLFSVLAALLLPGLLGIAAADWAAGRKVLYGLLLGSASVVAGFTQSAWKRRSGVKDSSMLIPEIGGVLDMVDSLLLAIPVAWLWYRLDPGAFGA